MPRGPGNSQRVPIRPAQSFVEAAVTFMGVAKRDLELDGLSIKAGWKGAGCSSAITWLT